MAYAIMRCTKLSGVGSVSSALQHCYRDRETPNANDARTPDNRHLGELCTADALERMRDLWPEKRRKDAVLAVEYLFTASPEWWKSATKEQQDEFFTRSRGWLAKKYGSDRIVTATIHTDETSPHMSAFVVPLTPDGRLSAKEFIGGRDKMRQDQTTFASSVAYLGLERGVEGSKANHQTIKRYYEGIERGMRMSINISPAALEPMILKKGLFFTDSESKEMVAERLSGQVNEYMAGTIANASVALSERMKRIEAENTIKHLSKTVRGLSAHFDGLERAQVDAFRRQAEKWRDENRRKREMEMEQRRNSLSKGPRVR